MPMKPDSLAGIGNPIGKTFAETCQVLLFSPSQIPAADWFAFGRYLRLHALYESLRVYSIMNLFFNTLVFYYQNWVIIKTTYLPIRFQPSTIESRLK
jgi:hypothetical protein